MIYNDEYASFLIFSFIIDASFLVWWAAYTRSIYRHNSCLFSDLKHEHNEVLDLSTSQTRDRNTNTKTKSRKRNKRKKVKLQRGSSQLDKKSNHKSGSVTEDEIAHHVSSMYVNGPGGYLKEASMKREKQSSSFDDKEYLKFLQKLDRHPALVLNADYQVRSNVLVRMTHDA